MLYDPCGKLVAITLSCSECRASVDDCYSGDFGGDMNHLHRVGVRLSCRSSNSDHTTVDISIVVKIAPNEVKVTTPTHTWYMYSLVNQHPRQRSWFTRLVCVVLSVCLVQFIKENSGETMAIDPRKADLEYACLCKMDQLKPLSVPRLYALDTKHKAS